MTVYQNITEGEEVVAFERLFCSQELTAGIHGYLIFLSVFNFLLAICSSLGNILILIALHKEKSLHAPSKLFLRSLATTDLLVGVISEPLTITFWISAVRKRWDDCYNTFFVGIIAGYLICSVSLSILTAISVDRLLALSLGLRYKHIVTLNRARAIVLVVWILCTVCSVLHVHNARITTWYSHILIPVCIVTSVLSYTLIFRKLRRHEIQVRSNIVQSEQSSSTSSEPLNISRYRKGVSGVMWLQLAVVFCYLPYVITTALWTYSGRSVSIAVLRQFAATLVHSNSALNPFLYCWKIREVRQSVKELIRKTLSRP
ncbi:adenosine receptor A2a-like [Stylophora pistillata]|uniref:adenosine receptor A2a-like n=1 Tax=Stylophora pistillata TaxID=50429 RepID=UPI000C04AE2A|nr:adenosine receptor A2a-like [Stylophora pistillata]